MREGDLLKKVIYPIGGGGGGIAPKTADNSACVSAANHPDIPCFQTKL